MRVADIIAAVAEVTLPSLCLYCSRSLAGGDRALCESCWSHLQGVEGPCCPRCGVPLGGLEVECVSCSRTPPPQVSTVLWGEYDGVLRAAVIALKHGGRDELATPLGARLAARLAREGVAAAVDGVTSVPSHPLRRLRRGWTAAEQIGRATASALRLPYEPGLLRRKGLTRQTGRTRAQRLALSPRSFAARSAAKGRELLLVDDVTTTGTTLKVAAAALLAAGASAVHCAALAWAADGRRMP